MKNTLKILGIIALTALVMFSMVACNKNKADSTTSAVSWDAYLADADKLATEIASLKAKAQAGDASASIAITEVIKKFEGLETKYSSLDTGKMTEAQAVKFMEIMGKMD
ncbi:MAG: hypothetical protein FWB73_07220 [Treponema sp.]|nr:hypothetical protein [Treponema sp.]